LVKKDSLNAQYREIIRRHLKKSKYADGLRRESIRRAAWLERHPELVAAEPCPVRQDRKVESVAKRTEKEWREAETKRRAAWDHAKNAAQAFLQEFPDVDNETVCKIGNEVRLCKYDARGDAWQTASLAVLNGDDPLKKVSTFRDREYHWRYPIIKRVGNKKTRVSLFFRGDPWTWQKDSIFDDDPHRDTRASYIKRATDSFEGGEQPSDNDLETLAARVESRIVQRTDIAPPVKPPALHPTPPLASPNRPPPTDILIANALSMAPSSV